MCLCVGRSPLKKMLKYFVIAPPIELNCPSFCVLFLVLFLQCLSCYLPFSLSSWVSCVKEGKGSFGLTTVKWCTLRECPSSFLDFVWLFVFWLRKFIESFWGSLEELRLKWKGKHGYVYKRMSRSVFFFANACVYLFFFFSFRSLTTFVKLPPLLFLPWWKKTPVNWNKQKNMKKEEMENGDAFLLFYLKKKCW